MESVEPASNDEKPSNSQEYWIPPSTKIHLTAEDLVSRGAHFVDNGDTQVREDTYEDDGCQFHPKCLECPEPDCLFVEGSRLLTVRKINRNRDDDMAERYRKGETAPSIAKVHGVTRRTVYRVLEYRGVLKRRKRRKKS